MEETSSETTAAPRRTGSRKLPPAVSLLRPSIRVILINLMTYVALGLLPFILFAAGFLPSLFASHANETVRLFSGGAAVMLGLAAFIVLIIILPAVVYTQIKGAAGLRVDVNDALGAGMFYLGRMIRLIICLGAIYTVSALLFFVPFLFMLRRYMLAPYYLVDRDLGVFEAMRQSAEDSKRFSGALWGLIGLECVLAVLNLIPFLGWILSGLYSCAPVVRYQQIKQSRGRQPTFGRQPATASAKHAG